MKSFYKFLMPLVAIVAMALPVNVMAQTLTVADGTTTNTYVPIYGYYCDDDQHNQVVYPASMLADMEYNYITSLTFYQQQAASNSWGTTVTIKMMEITDSVLTDLVAVTGATTVYTGTVNGTNTMETFVLTTPFEYQGGNLLVDITTTSASYSRNYWYGVSRTGASVWVYGEAPMASIYDGDDGDVEDFLPKTTFGYNATGAVCHAPTAFASTESDDILTFTWTDTEAAAWEFVYGAVGFDPNNATDVEYLSSTTTDLDLSLLANGMYDAYVRADCGDGEYSTWVGPVHFNVGMIIMNMATSGSDTLHTCAATIYDDGGPSGSYSNSCDATLVIYPSDNLHALSISGSSYTEGNYDYLRIYSGVGTSGDQLWNDYGVTSLQNFGPILSTDPVTITFHSDGSVVYSGFEINVSCVDMPDCATPETFVFEGADSNSVSLSWSDPNASAWAIGYGPAGFTLGDTNTQWADFTDTFGVVTGLTPNTLYDFYLMAVCGSDSSWTRSLTARTTCTAITTLPWSEDFNSLPTGNSVQFDYCWSIYNTTSATYNYPYVTSGYLYMYLYSSSSMNSQFGYAMLPPFDENILAEDLEMSFDIWGSSTASYGRGVIVGLFDAATPGMPVFDTVAVIIPAATSQSAAETHYVSFVGHEMTGKRLGFFYQNQQASATGSYYYTYIDNVNVHLAPSCFVPTNLTLNYSASDTLDFSWSDQLNGGASYWVEYRPTGAADTVEWTGIEVNDTNVVLDNLSANTSYDIMVRALCGGSDTSFALAGTYRTACGPISVLPWIETFNSMATTSSATNIPCWDYIGAGGYVNITSSYSHTSNCVRFYPNGSSTTDHVLVLPIFDTPISDLQMSFWTRPESSSSSGSFSVGYVTNPASADSFVEVLNIPCAAGTTVTQYEVIFSGAPEGSRIAMRHNVGSTAWYWYVDDIDVHLAPECNHPVGLTVLGSTASEATIGWGGDEDVTFRVWFDTGSTCDTATAAYVDIDSTHYTFTGLTENTTYSAVVATICGDGTLTSTLTVTFVTPEMGLDLPYATGFEATEDTAWVLVNGSQANQWFIGSAAGNPGNGLYISNDNGATNSYEIGSTTNVYAYRTFNFNAGQYAVSFDWRANGESCCDYLRAYLVPASVTLTAGTLYSGISTTGTPAGWIALDGGSMNVNSNWTTQLGVAIVPANATYKLVFVWHNDGSVGTAPAGAIDNISIVQLTCPQPTALTVDSTSTNSLDVSWTAGGTETAWEIRIDNGAWQTVNTTPSYQFTGLNSGTNYLVEVRAVCGADDESFITSIYTATLCAPISTLPYTETFDNWGTGSSVHAPNCYAYGSDYSSSYPYISSSYSLTAGGGSMYMYNYDNNHVGRSTWFALPMLDSTTASVNQTQLVFHTYASNTTYIHKARVGVSTVPSTAGVTWIDTVDAVYGQWTLHEVPFDSYTGNGKYVIVSSLVDSNYNYSYPYIDDLTLELIPSCPRPDSLTASNATTTTVDLAWHERGGASQWIIEYGPRGFQPGTGTVVNANTNPFTLTGIPVAYQGEYYVKSVCGAGDTGDYSRMPCGFETTQIPATLPYNYDFENVAEWNNWQTSTNHATNNWYRGTSVADSGSYAMYIAGGEEASYFDYTFNAVVNAAAYRDIDFGPIDSSYTLSFRARVGGTVDNRYDALMVFLVDPSLPTVPSTSNITTPWGNVNDLYRIATVYLDTTWQTYEASFDTISGVHRVAFFWFNQNTGADYTNIPQPAAVDNIHIDYSSCPRPLNVAINAGSTSAHVTWQGPAAANYEVIYRQYPGSYANSYAVANTNFITLTGLTSNTQYAVWVRKLCSASDTSLTSDGELFTTTLCEGGTEALNYDPSATATTSSYSPLGSSTWNYGYVQTIVDSANLASMTGDITAFAFNPVDGTKGDYYTNMTVFMANVSESDLSSGWILPDATHSFVKVIDSADFTYTEGGWQIHNLDTAFAWDGHSNLLIAVKRDHGTWSSGASFVAHTATASKMRYVYRDGSPYDYSNPNETGTASSTVGDIRLISCGGSHCLAPVVSSTTATDNSITVNFVADSAVEVVITDGIWDSEATGTEIMGNTHTFTGLAYNTTYTIGLRSICAEGAVSDWSIVTVTTEDVPCMEPTALAISDITFRSATATWTAGGEEANWEVNIFNTNINESYTTTSPTYAFSNLTTGTQYSVSVRALCGSDANIEGPWSDTVVFTTDACQATTQVSASSLTATTATISWAAAGNGTGSYILEYGFRGMSQGEGTSVTVNATSYTITGLQPETEYDVYISTVCEGGVMSVWSNVYSFTTPAASGNIYTISAVPADPTMGSVQGGGSYEENMQITLTAVPNEGYHFVRWQDGNTDNPRVVTVTGNATYVATFEANAGIEDINGAGYVSLYPNPASSTVTVSVEGNESEVVVTIVDMNGREVKRERTSGSVLTMDISSLSQGAYFVRLTGERVNAIRKLIVK